MVPGHLLGGLCGGPFWRLFLNMLRGLNCSHSRAKSLKSGRGGTAIRSPKLTLLGVPCWATKTAPGGGGKGGQKVQNSSFDILAPKSAPGPRGAQWEALGKLREPFFSSRLLFLPYI